MKMQKKLVIITNMMAPYRIPLFQKISEHSIINLHVVASDIVSKERSAWKIGKIKFPYTVVRKLRLKIFSNYYNIPLGLFGLLTRIKPQIIVVVGYSLDSIIAFFYSHIRGIQCYIWSAETLLSFKYMKFLKVRRFIRKILIKHTDGFLAYGPDAKKYLLSFNLDKEKIHVVNNICNGEPFKKIKKIRRYRKGNIMLYVGSFSPKKNVMKLLKAFRKITANYPDLRLQLVGDGPLRPQIKDYKRKFDLVRVSIMGELPSTEIPKVMTKADFLILPSIYDLWPHVVMEAMCSGLPVLCSNTAAVPPYIIRDGENGYYFSPYSADDISETIIKMMTLKDKWLQMGLKSTEIAKKYTIEKSSKLFINAIT
jgi:glycosyltransferase involved in cell wall biosynthesis